MIIFNKFSTSYIFFAIIIAAFGRAHESDWYIGDGHDEIKTHFDRVNGENCMNLPVEELYLSDEAVSHKPDIREFFINPIFRNRTELLQLHNIALSRSFFYSFLFQSHLMSPAIAESYDPSMLYYFLSTVADVSANSGVNASAIYFAPNTAYTSTYEGFFNKTLSRFAPRTVRLDDTSTMNLFAVQDLGVFLNDPSKDYTSNMSKINEWYGLWLPDLTGSKDDSKTSYKVDIIYANNSTATLIFLGPPGADEIPGPVKWTRPYFDCGRTNKWLVAAVVPIIDIHPRHIFPEHGKYTAINVLEMDFEQIDINQCPKGMGNDGPNKFSDTARCKKDTTECIPINGWGLKRGGYECRCKPYYRMPENVTGPYLGEIADKAVGEEWDNNFECLPINNIQNLPIWWDKAVPDTRRKILDTYPEYRNAIVGPKSLNEEKINIDEVLNFIQMITPKNCESFDPTDLILNHNFSFGYKEQFANEAKLAVRLASFLSSFLQISDGNEFDINNQTLNKQFLTENHIIGETLALVMGNSKIWSAGTYWDINKFPNKINFAPFAYKENLRTRTFKVDDLARINSSNQIYTENEWFKSLKKQWSTNFDNLDKLSLNIEVRENANGEHSQKLEPYPTTYKAGNIQHGYWTYPEFNCNGIVKKWLITYAAPFFGWDSSKSNIEFKGAVTVAMDILHLDINQCNEGGASNAFKNTHKCDLETTYCVPIPGRGFSTGGYKCECRQGFEYPFEDPITYYDGQVIDSEFQSLVEDVNTRYDIFKCRAIESESP